MSFCLNLNYGICLVLRVENFLLKCICGLAIFIMLRDLNIIKMRLKVKVIVVYILFMYNVKINVEFYNFYKCIFILGE